MAKITQYSAVNLIPEAGVDPKKWNTIPSSEVVEKTVHAIERRGIKVIAAADSEEALSILKNIVPPGAEVMNGSSTTLIEIGYEELISHGHRGGNLFIRVLPRKMMPINGQTSEENPLLPIISSPVQMPLPVPERLLPVMQAGAAWEPGLLLQGISSW